ncbi:ketopantoate reductase family protein [Pontibacter beigongshangensis]|uniref:ketopantoate reductase family protein n=1 Tax=Pontibacter beigongshangensis TaxID=2574733 RepID=UPI00164FA203|nr:2-dehydropantoate 2-reductase [Pontibacter beigongshangensis]
MLQTKKRIGILGIGGVGGFIGAPLAGFYAHRPEVEIVFICRGQTRQAIQENGLLLRSGGGEQVVFPDLVSDDPQEIGLLDALFLTTKSFSLAEALKTYAAVIGPDTVLLPLQNMVQAKDVIRSVLPEKGQVLEGCIYVVSNVMAPGKVLHKGGPGKVLVGGDTPAPYAWLIKAVADAGLDIAFYEDIKPVLWRKFLFLSPVAAITTAYNKTFGELLADPYLRELLRNMMLEVKLLAAATGVELHHNIVEESIALINNFPPGSKTSMQLDFEQQMPHEKVFLVDYVLEKGKLAGTPILNYQQVHDRISHLYPGN